MANQDPVRAMEALQRQSQERYQQLQTRYREDLSRLEEEQRRQMAQSRSRMLEMIREQQTEQVQQIRSEMEALRRETRERIAALERERDRKLEGLQDYYQRELDRLMERFQKNEEAEKNYAEIQRRAAQSAVRALEEDPTVKLFLPGAAAAAKERLESAEPLFEQHLYVVAAARWFTVAVTAASRSEEAREIRERWERRKKAAGNVFLSMKRYRKSIWNWYGT